MDAGSRWITLETPEAEARVARQGAHVTHWQPRGAEPVLFLSPRSVVAPGRAIRGGVPTCFPWFAARADDPTAPAHGFARATLDLALETTNTSAMPFTVEMALHTYVHVADVTAVSITGLEGATYIDQVDGRARKRAGAAPLRFNGSATTVVWNPGPARAAALADLGPDAWRTMVCVETANADDDRLTLAPGAVHWMSTTLSCG